MAQQVNKKIIPPCAETDHWRTPPSVLYFIEQTYNKGMPLFDPCPPKPKVNGLLIDWKSPAYVNPPYSRGHQVKWVKKAIQELYNGVESIFLLPADTSTDLWHSYIMEYAYNVVFFKGRIKFVGATGMPKFGSVLVHFKPEPGIHTVEYTSLNMKAVKQFYKEEFENEK